LQSGLALGLGLTFLETGAAADDPKFHPRDRGRVIFGPSKRRLAMLPIDQREGTLVVVAPFVGKLGVAKG